MFRVTPSAEKLGLFLPEGLHKAMLKTAERLNTRKNPRGSVRLIYERAFRELVEALDGGEVVTFPAVRGAKDRVSVRLSKPPVRADPATDRCPQPQAHGLRFHSDRPLPPGHSRKRP
ncbi:hypothetical protein [Phenylobacterium sp. J367]|uniref:hypothetical protein n=1 Tax=Phenylobacterium sp. J367 TaxID=2898435 RepID=UPI0021507CA6|nr:hypothetical protein [Phenylobacterium sp. J367]MCR5881320.1 hypothetical protein [Phenylobacterium sp. J367]